MALCVFVSGMKVVTLDENQQRMVTCLEVPVSVSTQPLTPGAP